MDKIEVVTRKQRKMTPISERFWAKVNKDAPNGCWEWHSSLTGGGYGAFFVHHPDKREIVRAHRFSWELANGSIPNGLWVLHKCDNRICVNPDHLFLGNRSDNMIDCARKGRLSVIGQSRKTHCVNGHEFTKENTIKLIIGHRRCRECSKRHAKNSKLKKAKAIRALSSEVKG